MIAPLEGGEWSAARPGRFTPGKDPVPIVQEDVLGIFDIISEHYVAMSTLNK